MNALCIFVTAIFAGMGVKAWYDTYKEGKRVKELQDRRLSFLDGKQKPRCYYAVHDIAHYRYSVCAVYSGENDKNNTVCVARYDYDPYDNDDMEFAELLAEECLDRLQCKW